MRIIVEEGTILYQRPGKVKLTYLKADTVFTVVNDIREWFEVDYGAGAWVSKAATKPVLAPVPNPIPEPIPNPEPVYVLVKAGTPIYQRPGESKLISLGKDTTFRYLTEVGDWFKVGYSAKGAWVSKAATRFVDIDNPVPGEPSPSPAPQPDVQVPPLPVPNGPYLYSMPDYVSRNEKNHPATRSPITTRFFKMTPAWTNYIIALNQLLNPFMSRLEFFQDFNSMFNGTRAFDNGHSYESGDWRIANLYCAGATRKIVSENIKKFDSREWMRVKGIPYNAVPRIPTKLSEIDMTLHFFPTTATKVGNNPFPQFGGRFLVPSIAAEWDFRYGFFDWVDITGYAERPGEMIRVDKIGHPFVPARWDITAGIIDP